MPLAALHQPAYTSAEWSVNGCPVRGSMPTITVGMPVLYIWGTALSGSTCCIADRDDLADVGAGMVRARADTGLPGGGFSTQPCGTTSSIGSKKPSFFGISGIHHDGDLADRVARGCCRTSTTPAARAACRCR